MRLVYLLNMLSSLNKDIIIIIIIILLLCNVGLHAKKPRQWKSMLTHQGCLFCLYMLPLLVSHTTEFVICISI